jgi:hypothetical protein
MAPPAKRLRCSGTSASLRTAILSSFLGERSSCSADLPGASRAPVALSPPGFHSSVLLDGLSCVSTEAGASAIESVREALKSRSLVLGAVVDVLLEDDEEAPPICCAAYLLEHGVLHATDLRSTDFAARACAAVGDTHSPCACLPTGSGALPRVIAALAAGGQSRARDDALSGLVRPLLVNGGGLVAHGPHAETAWLLASRTLDCLSTADMDPDDRTVLLSSWLRTAIAGSGLPSTFPAGTGPNAPTSPVR